MRAVGLVFWAQLRHRWRFWLAIAILIGLVGGVIMAAAAAGRRTESAFPDFVAAHGLDAEVYSTQPAPQIPRLSEVSAATVAFGPDNGQPSCACTHPLNPSYFGVLVLPTHARLAFNLVSGRLPEPSNPDEVLASYTLQQDEGLHLGSVIHVPFYAPSQLSAYNNATGPPPKPIGPTIGLRVVGFEATEFDFPTGATPSYSLYASQAFPRSVLPRVATGYAYFVRLRRGATDLPRFDAAVSAIGSTAYTQNEDSQIASVEASIHPQAVGWWLLAALAALVGLVVVAQALGRQSITESEEFPTLVALGIERRQLVLLGAARNVVVALAGSVGAVVLATFLSPIGPLGEARVAESSTGISFDVLVLAIGGLATILVVCALGIWPSVRATVCPAGRPDRRNHTVQGGRSFVVVGSAGERCDRCPQCAQAEERGSQRTAGQCSARHGAGGDCPVRDGGLWCQPLKPHIHAQALWRRFSTQYLEPQQQRDAESHALAQPRARP